MSHKKDKDPIERAKENYEKEGKMASISRKGIMKAKKKLNLAEKYKKWHT
jgi:hypothetical protein